MRDVAAATTSLISRALTARLEPLRMTRATTPGSRPTVTGSRSSVTQRTSSPVTRTPAATRSCAGSTPGTTTLVSRADGAAGALSGNDTYRVDVSGDGRLAVFETTASNFGDGDGDAAQDVFVRDLVASTTRLVSRADGDGAKATAHNPAISADGRIVGFSSAATSLGLPAGSPEQVFVRDLGGADDPARVGHGRRRAPATGSRLPRA